MLVFIGLSHVHDLADNVRAGRALTEPTTVLPGQMREVIVKQTLQGFECPKLYTQVAKK
jgi:hypothetical protein